VAGAREALEATTAMGLPFRVASNSSRAEMAAKFARAGLADILKGRIHSAYDLITLGKRGKPDPALFLKAAAAEGVPPESCLVVEDSLAGVKGAVAAGMPCLAYSPHTDGAQLKQAGAIPFRSLSLLPDLIRSFLHGTR
jgi:beta-phosphoglucomutase-like phosphatase (HAD superfamily)